MKLNRVLDRKRENTEKRKEDATQAISIMTNKSIQSSFDYSKLQNIENPKLTITINKKNIIFSDPKNPFYNKSID